jgi:hypothetical protein
MTPGAIRRELCHHVVGILRFLVVYPVTSYTRRGSSHILLLRRVGVARLTWHCLVPSEQREPRLLVFVHHIRHLPRFSRMTFEAVRSQLAPMNVCMTGDAVRARARELELPMTRLAFGGFVLPCQSETSLFVFERCVPSHFP